MSPNNKVWKIGGSGFTAYRLHCHSIVGCESPVAGLVACFVSKKIVLKNVIQVTVKILQKEKQNATVRKFWEYHTCNLCILYYIESLQNLNFSLGKHKTAS